MPKVPQMHCSQEWMQKHVSSNEILTKQADGYWRWKLLLPQEEIQTRPSNCFFWIEKSPELISIQVEATKNIKIKIKSLFGILETAEETSE